MSLSVSEKISQNNPHLEMVYSPTEDGFGYYPRCSLIPEPIDQDTSDFCEQVEGLTVRKKVIDYSVVATEFLPHFPIPCAQCPVYRRHLGQNFPAQSKSNPGQQS